MKTIAFLAQKGGCGKTTLAIHLAVGDTDEQGSACIWKAAREADRPLVVPVHGAKLSEFLDVARDDGVTITMVDTSPRASALAG